jgi:diguanylate cyclase (GGDEF)-like protein
MNIEPEQGHTVNHILPFALFGFLAPIATYLVAVSNLSQDRKTAILSVMAGLYVLLFLVSYKRLRGSKNSPAAGQTPLPVVSPEGGLGDVARQAGLPDERSFHIVLEHEVEETIRSSGDRPLSVLAIGVVDADAGSERSGYIVSSEIIEQAADKICKNLRAMDFAARSDSGEFLIVLPTANEAAAGEISARIKRSFAEDTIAANDGIHAKLRALIGIAAFDDGVDSAELLVSTARKRIREAEARMLTGSADPAGEYLN